MFHSMLLPRQRMNTSRLLAFNSNLSCLEPHADCARFLFSEVRDLKNISSLPCFSKLTYSKSGNTQFTRNCDSLRRASSLAEFEILLSLQRTRVVRFARFTSLSSLCRPRWAFPRSPPGLPAPFASLPCWPDAAALRRGSLGALRMSALRRLNACCHFSQWFVVVARRWAEVHARGVGVLRRIEQLDGRTNRHESNQYHPRTSQRL